MAEDKDRIDQTQTAQPGSQGQHGKGQSNPGGFDQQSSSSMEREQTEQNRANHQQSQRDQANSGGRED